MQQIQSDRTRHPLGAGMTMIAVVALFALGGRWLDERTGLSPLFLLLGFFLGALGGFIHLVAAISPELLPFTPKKTASQKPEAKPDEKVGLPKDRPPEDPDHASQDGA